ncbi:hypothetical protein Kpho02_54540 [Kitasatospora phosalacinea]|uniref:Uncharacterized protein n=1 Tax=Kitasatospora phosalacinea TaxID=2065 RepID=A0A9W6QA14_9ACTN|nr:hypothetical protein [Kitasatospora phosalacinea]GLW73155.1 hypothetical protein Kpho02_54540 [Kitasatospora phosalacinea]
MPQRSQQFAHGPAGAGERAERRRLDLTATQVAASALAAVAGAVLASELGVYGTILGAAVVSVGATVGSALFQHLLKRTGEHLRNAVERGTESAPVVRPAPAPANGISREWNAPRVLRAKRRWTWKSYAAVSGLVFVLAMVPIVAVELAAGKPLHDITTGQDGSGTSFNPSRPSGDRRPADRDGTPATGPSDPPPASSSPSSGPSSSAPADPSTAPSGSGRPSEGASGQPSPSGAAGSPEPSAQAPAGGAAGGQDALPGAGGTGGPTG